MSIDELILVLVALRKDAGRPLEVNIQMDGPEPDIRSVWIGASGTIYLTNDPPTDTYLGFADEVRAASVG